MNEFLNDRNLKKINDRNFKGMDLTNVYTQLSTELSEIKEECRRAKEERQKEAELR
jgi:hypothetical protein